jgi:ADP-ribose pyrophosphatase
MSTKKAPAPPPAEEVTAAAETTTATPNNSTPQSAQAKKKKTADKKPAVKNAAKKVAPAKKKAAPVAKAAKAAKAGKAKTTAPKAAPAENKKAAKKKKAAKAVKPKTATILSSEVVYDGPLFRVLHDKLIEPDGKANEREVIRHNGSVVILAIDTTHSKKNPWVVIERQYRHAANQYLWELPAGKLDAGEDALDGAKRELAEETGYAAKKWKPLVEYFASPGFLGESMKVFVAEGLVAGEAHPEADEQIEFRLVKLSDLVKMIDKGMIVDGKTLTSVLLYNRKLSGKHKK